MATIQQRSRRRHEHLDLPTPPPTRDGVQGHYTEDEQVDGQQGLVRRELQSLHDTVVNSLPPAGNDHFNQMMRQADTTLQLLITDAGHVEDPEDRRRVVFMAEAVGESMLAANRAAAAILSFRDANERLLAATISLGQYTTSIARAIQTNEDQ